jgi:hypothetical protein
MLYFSLNIDGKVVDLYKDESIELTRQIKDYSNIASVFTDFTKNFNIPASELNNSIFQNFFDENVLLQSWNQNYALSGQIYVHGLPVFDGVVELLEVKFKDGLPSDYSIVFYGKAKTLLVDWGEKTLADIDWSAYDHVITNAIAISSWTGGLLSGKVMWDIKDYGYGFNYSYQNVSNNLRVQGTLDYTNLRPSIKMKEMVQNIFIAGGFTLGGTLLARPEFDEMYVTPMNIAGAFLDVTSGVSFGNFFADNNATGAKAITANTSTYLNWRTLPVGADIVSGNASSAWDTTTYEYTIPQSGSYTFQFDAQAVVGATGIQYKGVLNNKHLGNVITNRVGTTFVLNNLSKGDVFKMVYQCTTGGTFKGRIWCLNSPSTIPAFCYMAQAMPEIKISDFFNSVLKTFNAILIPTSLTEFELHNIEDWYALGTNKKYTAFIDFKTMTHKKMPIPRKVEMSHEEGNSISQEFFAKTYKREFGAVSFSPDVDFADEPVEVKSIFTINPPSVIRFVNQQGKVTGNTDLEIPAIYDNDAKAIQQKLLLFYNKGVDYIINEFYFGTSLRTTMQKSSTFSGIDQNAYSLAFGLEGNIVGDMPSNSLYFSYWNEYMSRLYSTRSRIVVVDVVLPVGEWLTMQLNDNVSISGNYYKIQKITYDLLSQKAVIELITYPNVEILRVTGTLKNTPYFNNPATIDWGKTFIDGDAVLKGIGNAVSDGIVYITDAIDSENWAYSNTYDWLNVANNIMATLSLNKIAMYLDVTIPHDFDGVPTGIPMSGVGYEGDSSYYTPDLANSKVLIHNDGQYEFNVTIVFDSFATTPIAHQVAIDGIPTDAYAETHDNGLRCKNFRGSASVGAGQYIEFLSYTTDASTRTLDVYKVIFTINRII